MLFEVDLEFEKLASVFNMLLEGSLNSPSSKYTDVPAGELIFNGIERRRNTQSLFRHHWDTKNSL